MKKTLFLFAALIFASLSPIFAQQVIDNDLAIGNYSTTNGYGKYFYLRGTPWNESTTWIARYSTGNYLTDIRVGMGGASTHRFTVGLKVSETQWLDRFVVTGKGNVGILVANPQYQLDVNGTIRAKEVIVETGWADFVFKDDYYLPTLFDVESHINKHGHLPDMPSEAEVKKNGIRLSEMNTKLLQKVEELTLYVIQLNKEIENLKKSNNGE
jgi:hypothetical protein